MTITGSTVDVYLTVLDQLFLSTII